MTASVDMVLTATCGAFAWTFSEYVFHRWFHSAKGANFAGRKHLAHHARREYLVNGTRLLTFGGVLLIGMGIIPLISWTVLPGAEALTAGAGWLAACFIYEWIHAADHIRSPRTAYGRWARRSHFHHHFAAPLRNFGVTTPVWDMVFGTYDRVSRVTVPRRLAPVWLLDARGGVRPEFVDSYELRAGRSGLGVEG